MPLFARGCGRPSARGAGRGGGAEGGGGGGGGGLIIGFRSDNVLGIQPPLVITDEETERAGGILRKSIEDYQNGLIGDEVLTFARGWA